MYIAIAALLCLMSAFPSARADPGCNSTAGDSCIFSWADTDCGSCDAAGAVEGCNQRATVHLTIDDGPYEFWTTVLDILKNKQVKATFMVVGQQINGPNKPANVATIMSRIVAEGHGIGCHSQTHPHFNSLTAEQMQTEIQDCLSAVRTAVGITPKMFRPPFGECNSICMQQLAIANVTATYWTFDTNDWSDNMTAIETTVDSFPSPAADNTPVDPAITGVAPTVAPGLIMLMHMQDDMGLCALPTIIDRVRYKGWNFVDADQCYGAASLSTTPIPQIVPTPAQQSQWLVPQCTINGPVAIVPNDTTINGCMTNNGGCAVIGGKCTMASVLGAVNCTCITGYAGNGVTCAPVNECATNNGGCVLGKICVDYTPTAENNWKTFECTGCRDGYIVDGTTCTDINECALNNNGVGVCSSLVTCTNNAPTDANPARYTCSPCPSGYSGNGTTCTDINECLNSNCDVAAVCTNSPGSYQCACRQGFTGTGTVGDCVNINECATNNGGCSTGPSVACHDSTPSVADSWTARFTCDPCPSGYEGDGKTCTMIGVSSTGSDGTSSSSTGSDKDKDPSAQFSGAGSLSAGLLVTVMVPVLGHFLLVN